MTSVREAEAKLQNAVTTAVLAYQARLLAANTKFKLALANKVSENIFSEYSRDFSESVVLLQNALSEVQVQFASDFSTLSATDDVNDVTDPRGRQAGERPDAKRPEPASANTASATLPAPESRET